MENPHNPERMSPEIVVNVSGAEVTLNYYTTELFTFDTPYKDVNHIYVRSEELPGAYIFDSPDLLKALKKAGFPRHHQAWPNAVDEEVWIQHKAAEIDVDAAHLFKQQDGAE